MTQVSKPVVFTILPRFRQRVFYGRRLLYVLTGLVLGAVVIAPWNGTRPVILVAGAFIVIGSIVVSCTVHAVTNRRRNHALRAELDQGADGQDHATAGIQKLVFDLELARRLYSVVDECPWSWTRFESERARRGLVRPVTVADGTLRPVLTTIEQPSHMLEPERIASSLAMTVTALAAVVALFAFLAVAGLVAGDWLRGGFNLAIMALILVQVPAVRRWMPLVRFEDRVPVAGQGYVECFRRKRWTVDDAVMLVFAKSARGPIYVRLVGEAGWLTMTFMHPGDPDFLRLWQRWNHPQPRLELIA